MRGTNGFYQPGMTGRNGVFYPDGNAIYARGPDGLYRWYPRNPQNGLNPSGVYGTNIYGVNTNGVNSTYGAGYSGVYGAGTNGVYGATNNNLLPGSNIVIRPGSQ